MIHFCREGYEGTREEWTGSRAHTELDSKREKWDSGEGDCEGAGNVVAEEKGKD
jgi:hypothetical protein